MSTDLKLTSWQKKQAVLLYYFSSLPYLKELQRRVQALRNFADSILDTSRVQDRDRYLRTKQWGSRDTSENWENNAWPFLADFQRSVAESIVNHASNIYGRTGASQCARGISEFSMQWTMPEEERQFDQMFADIVQYARYIDQTMDRTTDATRWTDFGLTLAWHKHTKHFLLLPKLRASPIIIAESGQLPPKTGVYVSVEDPHAALQFAWNGTSNGRLLNATTFNETGMAALETVGRAGLWTDQTAMLHFVQANANITDLYNDPFFDDSQTTELAASLVARNSFRSRPSHWSYVELIEEEFEELEDDAERPKAAAERYEAGQRCPQEGFYFSPASPYSRRCFRLDEKFPEIESTYGRTIWQREKN